jgi:TonB family protein
MNPKLLLLCVLVAAFAFLSPAAAQVTGEGSGTEPTLLSKPDIIFPEGAKARGLTGELRLWVSVDSEGNVISVESVTGPGWVCPSVPGVAEVQQVAREAAMMAKFIPATKDGTAILSRATITYERVDQPAEPIGITEERKFTVVRRQSDDRNPTDDEGDPPPPPDYQGPIRGSESGYSTLPPGAEVSESSRAISGGVLNGKARTLSAPVYPPAARAVRASGIVTIQVVIGEEGNMLSAEPLDGHPLLRPASRVAACSSSFSPTLLEGRPVKVSGVIVYKFTL